MTLKEYKIQLALGTVDFRSAAFKTQSNAVLQDIIMRTSDIATLCAVATNLKANIYTLSVLATFSSVDKSIIILCAYHPNMTLNRLKLLITYPIIRDICVVQQRVRALQLATGISEEDALMVEEKIPEKFIPYIEGSVRNKRDEWPEWNEGEVVTGTKYCSIYSYNT